MTNREPPPPEERSVEQNAAVSSGRTAELPTPKLTSKRPKIGCGYLMWWLFGACILIVLNSLVFTSFYEWVSRKGPRHLQNVRVTQACLVIGPIVMLLIQFWIKDLLWPLRKRPQS